MQLRTWHTADLSTHPPADVRDAHSVKMPLHFRSGLKLWRPQEIQSNSEFRYVSRLGSSEHVLFFGSC